MLWRSHWFREPNFVEVLFSFCLQTTFSILACSLHAAWDGLPPWRGSHQVSPVTENRNEIRSLLDAYLLKTRSCFQIRGLVTSPLSKRVNWVWYWPGSSDLVGRGQNLIFHVKLLWSLAGDQNMASVQPQRPAFSGLWNSFFSLLYFIVCVKLLEFVVKTGSSFINWTYIKLWRVTLAHFQPSPLPCPEYGSSYTHL